MVDQLQRAFGTRVAVRVEPADGAVASADSDNSAATDVHQRDATLLVRRVS